MLALRSLVWTAAVVATSAACGGSNPSAGSIVLQSDRDGEPEIFVLDPDGGAPLQLTDNDDFDGNPDWSPDGSRLVFTSDRDGGLEIFMMNADGSGVVQLTDDDVDNGAADWSPDGKRIVFDGFDAEGILQVYTMEVEAPSTTTAQLTTEGANGKAVWSPDGERIAFISRRDGQGDIYVMAADGSGQVNLTNDASLDGLAAWSTDGTQIAFMSDRSGDREIYTMAADGSDVVRLTHDPGADSNPTWAHGDTEVMFTSNRDGDLDVYAMAPDGSDVRNLTQNPAFDFVPDWTPATNERPQQQASRMPARRSPRNDHRECRSTRAVRQIGASAATTTRPPPTRRSLDPKVTTRSGVLHFTTRKVRCVTPAPSITLVRSRSIGPVPRWSNNPTPPPSRTGTRSMWISSRSPALMHCCTMLAAPHPDVLVTGDRFRLREGAFQPVGDERERRSFLDPLWWDRAAHNKDRHIQGVFATPPMGEVERPSTKHQRPGRFARLAEELGGLRRDPEDHVGSRQPVYGVASAVPRDRRCDLGYVCGRWG